MAAVQEWGRTLSSIVVQWCLLGCSHVQKGVLMERIMEGVEACSSYVSSIHGLRRRDGL